MKTFADFMKRKAEGALPRVAKTARYGFPYIYRMPSEKKDV